jgi:hypothetical protein
VFLTKKIIALRKFTLSVVYVVAATFFGWFLLDFVPESLAPLALLSLVRSCQSFIDHGGQLVAWLDVAFSQLGAKATCNLLQLWDLVECLLLMALTPALPW